jgi:hypothetical protein
MKKNNKVATACDNVLFFFDQDCTLTDVMADQTRKESERILVALEKGKLIDSDDLTDHENDIRSIAFAMGYFCGTGQIFINKQAQYAFQTLKSAWHRKINIPSGLKK